MVCSHVSYIGKFDTYWANTSGNGLAGKLIREGVIDVKSDFEDLLNGKVLEKEILKIGISMYKTGNNTREIEYVLRYY